MKSLRLVLCGLFMRKGYLRIIVIQASITDQLGISDATG